MDSLVGFAIKDIENARKQLAYEVKFNRSSYGNEEIEQYMRLALDACEDKLYGEYNAIRKLLNAIDFFRTRHRKLREAPEKYGREMNEDWSEELKLCEIAYTLLEEKLNG